MIGRSEARLIADEVTVVVDGAELLAPVSADLAQGECVAILGPNGSGKTTLLRSLAGRVRPTSGTVTLDSAPLDERRTEVRRRIAPLIDPPALYPDLTLGDHLRLIETVWLAENTKDRRNAVTPGLGVAALDAFGISHLADRFPHELSSGQRQLTSLAVTFSRPADFLILDEPEQRLDESRRRLVGEAILAAQARGVAIAFATHDGELVDRVADRSVRVGE